MNSVKDFSALNESAESIKQKIDFLMLMSHEIRTPLNAIIGITQLFEQTSLTFEQQELLDNIRTSSFTLMHTVNDMLDFSRLDAGRFSLNPASCNLRKVIDDSVMMVSDMMQQKHLELITLVDPQVPALALTDEVRLRQLLLNLLSNACKYTNYGHVCLQMKVAHITPQPEGNPLVRLYVSVADTGIGIPVDKQSVLFQQFSQVHTPESVYNNCNGSGLGLSICKAIVELMNGRIGVYSQEGKGSTFWFEVEMPLKQAARAVYLPFSTILFVEENAAVRDLRKSAFEQLGLKVIVESTILGALHHPMVDAVVVSYPYTELHEQARPIFAELADSRIPVFLLVNRRTRPDVPFPVAGLLQKPIATHILQQQLSMPRPLNTTALPRMLNIPEAYYGPPLPPISDTPSPPVATVARKPTPSDRPLILVVEDNMVNQKVVGKFLDKLNYRYELASNGLEALEAVKKTPYALILMDCQMPELDGYQATALIRQQLGLVEIPIIALTAHALAGERQKCLDAGMNDYLPKPVDAVTLGKMLEKYLADVRV